MIWTERNASYLETVVAGLLPVPEGGQAGLDSLGAAGHDFSRKTERLNDGVVANLSGLKTIVSAFGKKLYYYYIYLQS